MMVSTSPGSTARQEASKSKSGSPFASRSARFIVPSASASTQTIRSTAVPSTASRTTGRNCSSQTMTLFPALPNTYFNCSGASGLYTENGVALACSAAVSTRWNSGRLVSMMPTVSPWRTPSFARPEAIRRTRSPYRRQVMTTPSSGVRSATASGSVATVDWNASHSVRGFVPVTGGIVILLDVVDPSFLRAGTACESAWPRGRCRAGRRSGDRA